jgi:IS5 family transposase
LEEVKVTVSAQLVNLFRVIKRQSEFVKARVRRLTKRMAQLHTLFVMSNLLLMMRALMFLFDFFAAS